MSDSNVGHPSQDEGPGVQTHMTPTSTTSTKAERNRRKKENAKRRKAEENQKEVVEAELLEQMSAMALKEKALDSSRHDDRPELDSTSNGESSNKLYLRQEAIDYQLNNSPSKFILNSFSIHFFAFSC